jgi:hypothetical protein
VAREHRAEAAGAACDIARRRWRSKAPPALAPGAPQRSCPPIHPLRVRCASTAVFISNPVGSCRVACRSKAKAISPVVLSDKRHLF